MEVQFELPSAVVTFFSVELGQLNLELKMVVIVYVSSASGNTAVSYYFVSHMSLKVPP